MFTPEGGIWTAALANNYLLLIPYRWVGYLFALWTPLSANSAYKISFLLIGLGTFLLGIYSLAKEWFYSRVIGCYLTALACASSLALAVLHQEQALSTLWLLPWIWLAILKAFQNHHFYPLVLSLLGLSFNWHYPHLVAFYSLGSFLLALSLVPKFRTWLKEEFRQKRWSLWSMAILAFFVSASPVIYSYSRYHDKLISPFRGQNLGITAQSYEEYLQIARLQKSSVVPSNFVQYFGLKPTIQKEIAPMDEFVFFMTVATPLIFFLSFIFPFSGRGFQMAVMGLLLLLACGIYTSVVNVLWNTVPTLGLFRQWFHFVPILNLHWLFFMGCVCNAWWKIKQLSFFQQVALLIAAAFLLLLSILGLSPWWNGNGAALILLLLYLHLKPLSKLSKMFQPKLVFSVLIGVWILGGSVFKAKEISALYYRFLPRATGTDPAEEKNRFTQQVFYSLSPLFEQTHALVKPPQNGALKNGSLTHQLPTGWYWTSKQGNVFPVRADEILFSSHPSAIQLTWKKTPVGVSSLILTQWNDGQWYSSLSRNSALPRHPQGWVQLPIEANNPHILLWRDDRVWCYLLFLMWVPFIVSMLWANQDILRWIKSRFLGRFTIVE